MVTTSNNFLKLVIEMAEVVFSIVSHGNQKLINKLVKTIDQFIIADKVNLKIVITENRAEFWSCRSHKFDISFNYNLRERGFGANHNSVFENFKSDYFFVINPDIQFIEKVNLDNLVKNLQINRIDIGTLNVVGASGKIEDHVRVDITLLNIVKRKFGLQVDINNKQWFAGMFMVFKSSKFRQLQGFDTRFYMYVEDCDICMRAHQNEFNLHLINDARVMHLAQRASRRSLRHFYWHVKSLFRYLCNI